MLVFLALPDVPLGFFKPSTEFLEIGRAALRTTCLGFVLAAVSVIIGGCFQALGNGVASSFVSLCRQMIVLLPAAYLLSLAGEVRYIWWAFPIAELFGLITAIILYKVKAKPFFKTEE